MVLRKLHEDREGVWADQNCSLSVHFALSMQSALEIYLLNEKTSHHGVCIL